MPNELVLRAGRERSVLRRHPWVFSGSVAEVRGSPGAGETVDLVSAAGEWLARAAFSPTARIAARVWTWDPEELVDAEFFRQRMERSIEARCHSTSAPAQKLGPSPARTTARASPTSEKA